MNTAHIHCQDKHSLKLNLTELLQSLSAQILDEIRNYILHEENDTYFKTFVLQDYFHDN